MMPMPAAPLAAGVPPVTAAAPPPLGMEPQQQQAQLIQQIMSMTMEQIAGLPPQQRDQVLLVVCF
jgi:hypothetical protein